MSAETRSSAQDVDSIAVLEEDLLKPYPKVRNDKLTRPLPVSWSVNLLLTLPFLLLFWFNLAHHELWLDELNAWGISVASPTLQSLFANVHYEGHPWLWYFILWIPSRFTHAPVAMKWVEVFIGSAIYLVIGLASPFTRLQKVLVFLNYFVVFEYTVISRPYGVMLLLALLYTWRRSAKPHAYVGNLALLGALANTDMTGILLSGALLLEYVASLWTDRRDIERPRAVTGSFLYGGMLLFSVHSLLPAPDISWYTTGRMFSMAGNPMHLFHAIANVLASPWWPFAKGYPHPFWNTDVEFTKAAVTLIPFVLAGYYWVFRKQRHLLALMGAVLLFAISFAHLVYLGFVRHWGITTTAFLLGLWIFCQVPERRRTLSRVAYALLLLGAVKGVAAIAASLTHPFSETGNVAAWIRQQHLDQGPIAGTSDYALAGIAEQLERPVYFLDCNCIDTYMKFAHRRDGLTPEQIPARIVRAYDSLHATSLLLVMDSELTPQAATELKADGMRVQWKTDFSGSEEALGFHLYSVERTSVLVRSGL